RWNTCSICYLADNRNVFTETQIEFYSQVAFQHFTLNLKLFNSELGIQIPCTENIFLSFCLNDLESCKVELCGFITPGLDIGGPAWLGKLQVELNERLKAFAQSNRTQCIIRH